MADIAELIDERDGRVQITRAGDVQPESDGCVLLWVQRTQRAHGNHAASLAIDLANKLSLPVVALFCLVPAYPGATLRAYHFMAEGLTALPDAFASRNIGWVLEAGDPCEVVPRLARDLRAVAIVTDMAPTRDPRAWKEHVAGAIEIPMVQVDADVVIPTAQFTKLEWAPRTIRPKILPLIDTCLTPIPDPEARVRSELRRGPDPMDVIAELAIDRSVGPSPRFKGGEYEARKRLNAFVNYGLADYHELRNRSDLDSTSGLSPYLHFGQIGPVEVALAARAAMRGREGTALDAFFNELIVQRELCINFALHEPAYDRYAGLPDWGRKTLDDHRQDPRPHRYQRGTLEAARTADPLWNAAQIQLVREGYMPNRLRMYWAKCMLLWIGRPETAFEIALEMNDRYFVDGRDPNGYAGLAWAVGGRHDRPFPPNKPVLGLVRPMTIKAMRRSFDTDAYIASIRDKYGPI